MKKSICLLFVVPLLLLLLNGCGNMQVQVTTLPTQIEGHLLVKVTNARPNITLQVKAQGLPRLADKTTVIHVNSEGNGEATIIYPYTTTNPLWCQLSASEKEKRGIVTIADPTAANNNEREAGLESFPIRFAYANVVGNPTTCE